MIAPYADAGDSFREFFDAFDQFFENLAAIGWGKLLIAMLAFVGYLTLRSRASYNILRAAYPQSRSSGSRSGARTSPATASTASSRRAAATSCGSS